MVIPQPPPLLLPPTLCHLWCCCCRLAGDNVNDLHTFDTDELVWTALVPAGPLPPPRIEMGFVALGGTLYLFGGATYSAATGTFGGKPLWLSRNPPCVQFCAFSSNIIGPHRTACVGPCSMQATNQHPRKSTALHGCHWGSAGPEPNWLHQVVDWLLLLHQVVACNIASHSPMNCCHWHLGIAGWASLSLDPSSTG